MKKLLMLIPLLISCNATMQKKTINPVFVPEWVKAVESGSQPIVRRARETYFRSIFEGYGNSTQLCEKAIEHNLRNVRRLYPELGTKMPYEVKSVFYLPPNKCATTISLSHTVINRSLQIRKERIRAETDERERNRPRTDGELITLALIDTNKYSAHPYRTNQKCVHIKQQERAIACGYFFKHKGEDWIFMRNYKYAQNRTFVIYQDFWAYPLSKMKKAWADKVRKKHGLK